MDFEEKEQWYCVHIPRSKILRESNSTFVDMFKAEHQAKRSPVDCPVHYAPAPGGDGMCYFFSPEAAQRFSTFAKYWGAFEIPSPEHLEELPRLV